MMVSEQSKALPQACGEALPQAFARSVATREKLLLSKMVASTFVKFDLRCVHVSWPASSHLSDRWR